MIISDYFIMGLDQYSVLKHSLSWWQQNHPSWILYACTASGAPTHDVAYMSGIRVPDVPLDIHNPDVVAYQAGVMSQYAKGAGYNALAIDQVVFWNVYAGGNPDFGQHVNKGEYGCGTWQGNTFVRHYSSPSDSQYAADVVQYVRQARSIAHSYGLTLIVNHPAGPVSNPNEQQLLLNTDVEMDETGFSDYGHYTKLNGGTIRTELPFIEFAQQHGTAVMVIDKFANEGQVDPVSLEYSIATYLLGNEGGLLLWVGGAQQYGTLQYYSQYDAPIGKPCGSVSGGPAVYTRSFSGGLVVVNGTSSPQTYSLPSGHSYHDLVGRSTASSLRLGPNDAYVLLSSTPSC